MTCDVTTEGPFWISTFFSWKMMGLLSFHLFFSSVIDNMEHHGTVYKLLHGMPKQQLLGFLSDAECLVRSQRSFARFARFAPRICAPTASEKSLENRLVSKDSVIAKSDKILKKWWKMLFKDLKPLKQNWVTSKDGVVYPKKMQQGWWALRLLCPGRNGE